MDVLKKAARVSQIIMGLALLIAGLVKVWEPVLFYWEVVPFGQLMNLTDIWHYVAQAALLMGPFECALGIALLSNWRPRLTYPVLCGADGFLHPTDGSGLEKGGHG